MAIPDRAGADPEVDVHIWCEPETVNTLPLFTLSHGRRCLTRAVPKEQALAFLGEFLDDLASGEVTSDPPNLPGKLLASLEEMYRFYEWLKAQEFWQSVEIPDPVNGLRLHAGGGGDDIIGRLRSAIYAAKEAGIR